ncbi:hypothetical protein MMPV_002836 [Pyropia vietnamensis]
MSAPSGNPRGSFLSRRVRPGGGSGVGGGDGARSFLRRPHRTNRTAVAAASGSGGPPPSSSSPLTDASVTETAAGGEGLSSPPPSVEAASPEGTPEVRVSGQGGGPDGSMTFPAERGAGGAAAAGGGGNDPASRGDAPGASTTMPVFRRPLPSGSAGRSFLRRPAGSGGASFLRKPARVPPLRVGADGACGGGGGGGSAVPGGGGVPPRDLSVEPVWVGPDGPAAYAAFHATSLRAPVLCPAEFGNRAKWAVDIFSLPHNAIRRELMDLFKMMADAALLGTSLTAAHVREVAAWWKVFHDFFLDIRGLEGGVILPWVGAARSSAPDLGYFLEALAEQRELIENLRADAHAAFRRLYMALDPAGEAPNNGGWVSASLSAVTSPSAGGSPAAALLSPSAGESSSSPMQDGTETPEVADTVTTSPPPPSADGAGVHPPPPPPPHPVNFASKLVEYFGAQERFLSPVVHRHYADPKERRRLTAKMVDGLLNGRLPRDGVVLLVAWIDDVPTLNALLARHLHGAARLAYPKWLARFEDGHRAHVERLHLAAAAAREGGAASPRPDVLAAAVAAAAAGPPGAGVATSTSTAATGAEGGARATTQATALAVGGGCKVPPAAAAEPMLAASEAISPDAGAVA